MMSRIAQLFLTQGDASRVTTIFVSATAFDVLYLMVMRGRTISQDINKSRYH